MKIIVPSLGRAGSCPTTKWLKFTQRQVIFAVHMDEADAYRLVYPSAEIWVLPDEVRHHTGKLRKYILDHMREPFIFCDDDIHISMKGCSRVDEVFDVLERHIESGASIAGLGQQLFSNGQIEKTIIINGDPWAIRNQFVATVYAINPKDFVDCPLDKLAVYEDVALVIHGIQRGGTITTYIATHSNVSPPEGGCNAWRDKQITIDCLNKMVELYPGICSTRPTDSTTHSQYLGIGLKVAWSKIKRLN